MDNDLDITDHCPGFGSAARYAGEAACELALDASGLPIHVVVLELGPECRLGHRRFRTGSPGDQL